MQEQIVKVRGNSKWGLLGTTLGFFFGFAAVSLYGPAAVYFKESMKLSPQQLGFLVAIPALSGSLLRIPFGAWVDTTGGKKPFSILLFLSATGLGGVFIILYFFYPNNMVSSLYAPILFLGFLSGCGIATFSVGIGQTSYWFPQNEQGHALGIYAGVGNLAPGIFSLLLPLYLSHFGLVSAYFAWWMFLLIGIAIFFRVGVNAFFFQYLNSGLSRKEAIVEARKRGQEIFPTGSAGESLKCSARKLITWQLVMIYFTTFGGFIALTTWFPSFWSFYFKTSVLTSGLLTGVYSILTSIIRVFGGVLSDKYGGETVAFYSLMIMLAGSVMITFSSILSISLIAALLLAIGMGVANAAVFKLVAKYIPEHIGGAAGWVGGLGAFGGFAIPPFMGWMVSLLGRDGYIRGFSVFIILSMLCLILIYMIRNHGDSPREVQI